ncbi:MAG: phosphotransferase [Streptomyces sp.]|nr:phosphotransferase [Streptomyces sp.]
MGPSPRPRPHHGGRVTPGVVEAFVALAASGTPVADGPHGRVYELPLSHAMAPLAGLAAGTPVIVRTRHPETRSTTIRTWPYEAQVVRAVRAVLPAVPERLFGAEDFVVHTAVDGLPLSELCGDDKHVASPLIDALTEQLARLTQVRGTALPTLPADWPGNHTDRQGFLRIRALMAHRQVVQPNWTAFGGLFTALGVPADAMLRLAEQAPVMSRRPYSVLHTALSRDSLIMPADGGSPVLVDWESATYGDPLYELAAHVVRMRYPSEQWDEVTESWAKAMRSPRPAAVNGLGRDLRHYIAFEQALCVYQTVMTAARSLLDASGEQRLDEATGRVSRVLEEGARSLGLGGVPGEPELRRILFRWRAARNGGRGLSFRVSRWSQDPRFPEHPDFPRPAVREALIAEGAAPSGRVFKGTGHLNSVVRVAGVDFPVVVRRKVANVCRRERGFLSEHAVLRAIERSGAAVAAPRFLALGSSYEGEPFAIHTYEGPQDTDQPPNHPVHGLLPHEADGLVDQLHALTAVDYKQLDPAAGQGDFYPWLSEQLVLLVGGLPKESQQLARILGLPDAPRLREILTRHRVSHRTPTLLHGDLNPWNLVRRPGKRALTIIDWEMAVVGDPLYDLVRHMHLTPTRPEIRERMFRRWSSLLSPEHTVAWERDWDVYRWIEIVRSAYIDLDRLVTGASLDAPNVRRALDSYAMTLAAATASLGLPARATASPHLARAFA